MPPLHPDSLVQTLETLKRAFQVRHISVFPVQCVSPGADHELISRLFWNEDFSHVPVRGADGRIQSVFCRPPKSKARASFVPQDFVETEHVIAADAPLLEAVRKLSKDGFLLVKSPESGFPDQISGIVNDWDIQKPPVRLIIFTMLSELEARLHAALPQAVTLKSPDLETLVREFKVRNNFDKTFVNQSRWLRTPEFLRIVRNAIAHSDWIAEKPAAKSDEIPDPRVMTEHTRKAIGELQEALAYFQR